MKIGYMRWGYPIELDYLHGSVASLGTDLRTPIINTLAGQGHKITIRTFIKKEHQKVLAGQGAKFDYSNFKDVEYETRAKPEDDIIILEETPCFTLTDVSENGEDYNLLRRNIELLRGFDGKLILYHHSDFQSRFHHLWQPTKARPGASEKNIKNLARDINLPLENIVVWSHVHNLAATKNRIKHFEQPAHVTTPIGYDPNFEPQRPFDPDTEHKFIYVGANKANREKQVKKFLLGLPYSVLLAGKGWKEGQYENINCIGKVPGHAKIYDLYKDAKYSFIPAGQVFRKTGQETTRYTQTINSGLATFADKRLPGAARTFGMNALVEDRQDLYKKVEFHDPADLVQSQQANLLTWDTVLTKLLEDVT